MNEIMVIRPRYRQGCWTFSDSGTDLIDEPFVGAVNNMIDHLTRNIADARNGFRMTFSANPFPGWQEKLTWLRADENNAGNWYWSDAIQAEGWLCPALFRYFDKAPAEIYVQAGAWVRRT